MKEVERLRSALKDYDDTECWAGSMEAESLSAAVAEAARNLLKAIDRIGDAPK